MAAPGTSSGELTLIFDRVPGGMGSNYLYTLKPGMTHTSQAPMGTSHFRTNSIENLILIARYTGLVPIRCMLKQLVCAATDCLVLADCAVAPLRMNCSSIRNC